MIRLKLNNGPKCNVCNERERGLILTSAKDEGTALIPPIAICPRCDYVHEDAAGPPAGVADRVRDFG